MNATAVPRSQTNLFLKQILLEVTTATDSRESPWSGRSDLTWLQARAPQKKTFIGKGMGVVGMSTP